MRRLLPHSFPLTPIWMLLILISSPAMLTAQNQERRLHDFHSRNAFFVEAAGKAINYSLNYERRYLINESQKVGVQVGVAPATGVLYFPLSVNAIWGSSAHQLETGLGLTLEAESKLVNGRYTYHGLDSVRTMATAHIGYRYQPSLGGILFRVAYTPRFEYPGRATEAGRQFVHWFGISLGWALKNHNIR